MQKASQKLNLTNCGLELNYYKRHKHVVNLCNKLEKIQLDIFLNEDKKVNFGTFLVPIRNDFEFLNGNFCRVKKSRKW